MKTWRVSCPAVSDEAELFRTPTARAAAIEWATWHGVEHDDTIAVIVTGEDGKKHAFELTGEIVYTAHRIKLEDMESAPVAAPAASAAAIKTALEAAGWLNLAGLSDENLEILKEVHESMNGPLEVPEPSALEGEHAQAFDAARAVLQKSLGLEPETYAEMRARHAREDETWKGVGEALRSAFPKEE